MSEWEEGLTGDEIDAILNHEGEHCVYTQSDLDTAIIHARQDEEEKCIVIAKQMRDEAVASAMGAQREADAKLCDAKSKQNIAVLENTQGPNGDVALRVAIAAFASAALNIRNALLASPSAQQWLEEHDAAIKAIAATLIGRVYEHRLAQERAKAYRRCATECPQKECDGPYEVFACDVRKVFEQWAIEAESQPSRDKP